MAATTVSLHLYHSLSSRHPKSPRYPYSIINTRHHVPILNPHRSLGLDSIRTPMVNPRNGVVTGAFGDDLYEDDDDDDEDDEEEEDRSLEFLVRFVENVFRKISRRARKAVKSVLPIPISTRLVGFAVNGTLILTFLWVLKAFLQVICTLGSVVFASILLIRGIWTGISYFQENRVYREEDGDRPKSWTNTRPAF